MKRLAALLLMLWTAAGWVCGGTGEMAGTLQGAEEVIMRLPDAALMSYYDDALFVGDSLMHSFHNYVNKIRKTDPGYFGEASFRDADSYKLRFATYKTIPPGEMQYAHIRDQGNKVSLYSVVKKDQPGKLILLAGLNDAFTTDYRQKEGLWTGMERAAGYVEKIAGIMEEASPQTEVCMISQLPVTASAVQNKLKGPALQERWDLVNERVYEKCMELGVRFIDAAAALKGEDGMLPPALSSDGTFHLNDAGNEILARVLLDFAQAEYEAGNWVPGSGTDH